LDLAFCFAFLGAVLLSLEAASFIVPGINPSL
jgi:hypothetical protein